MSKFALLFLLVCSFVSGAFAQEGPVVLQNLSQAEIDRIVKTFTEKEATYRAALNNYSFKRDAVMQTVGMGGQITGEYRRQSLFTFDDNSKRYEKILFFPLPTLKAIGITVEDLEDLGGVNAFALEPQNIGQYNFAFVGKQKIDEVDLFVFDVAPKVMPDPKTKLRLFQGRIWIDDRDLLLVKSKGKGVPETKTNKFPLVETWRENIDGKYWFPTYAYSNDELVFDNGYAVKIKLRVTYTDYKEAVGTIRILDDEEEVRPEPPAAGKAAPVASPVAAPTPKPATKP